MFSLCFLSSAEKVSGDGRKTAMKGKRQRQTVGGGEATRRGSNRSSSLVINVCAIVCSVSLSARTKEETARKEYDDGQHICADAGVSDVKYV